MASVRMRAVCLSATANHTVPSSRSFRWAALPLPPHAAVRPGRCRSRQQQIARHPQRQQQKIRAPACSAVGVPVATIAASNSELAAVIVGWLVVAGSCIRSLPQILRILKAKSVEGLSLASFGIETVCCSISLAYNLLHAYPFSTFGDTAICLVQNVIIMGLILAIGPPSSRPAAAAASAAIATASTALLSGMASPAMLTALQSATVVLLACARIPQIALNVRRGNSGELSAGSTGLSVIGNAMRVFTTLQLVKDPFILWGAASQLCLNGILLYQCIDTAQRRAADHTAAADVATPAPA